MVKIDLELTQALKDYVQEKNDPLVTAIADMFLKYNMNDEDLLGALSDVCTHGAMDCGYLTYYTEGDEFFEKFKEQINDLIREEMDSFGYKSIVELIPSIDYSDPLLIESSTHSNICWVAIEVIAHQITNALGLDD